jgi:hypothetical protein
VVPDYEGGTNGGMPLSVLEELAVVVVVVEGKLLQSGKICMLGNG